ncbi:MAG: MFS transporter [Solobacterium sp.]|nr:MFS transporter [Solobacterium sp.]
MTASSSKSNSVFNIPAFWKAQMLDWRITVVRTSLERLGYKMILPYLTLYIVLLGATKTQYGLINSLGMVMGGILAPAIGSIIDRNGPKKVYIFGILVLIGGYLALASARVWQVAALGLFLHAMGSRLGGQSCATICGNCLANCDRAKGMLVCESLAAGVLGMVGPMISGWILVNLMGVTGTPTDPNSIRPLFYIALFFTVVSLLIIIFKLSFRSWGGHVRKNNSVLQDGIAILKADKNCRKWLLISAVNAMPMAMVIPYVQVFAAEAKAADAATLAGMVTATALTSVLCGYIIGIISDKYGRKPVLLFTIVMYLLGLILLITTKTMPALLIVGMLAGFQEIGATVSASIQNELVPHRIMGRWIGAVSMFSSIFSAAMAALSGIIYDGIGGQWVFIIYIICELVIRIPLLISMPETLTSTVDEAKFANI